MRTIPLDGTDAARLSVTGAFPDLIKVGEIHTTTDQLRVFLHNNIVSGAVWHGEVSNESQMLALNTTQPRGCFSGDFVKRGDTDTVWMCIAERGTVLAHWIEVTSPSLEPPRFEPLTVDDDPDNPEILFESGDVLMELIP